MVPDTVANLPHHLGPLSYCVNASHFASALLDRDGISGFAEMIPDFCLGLFEAPHSGSIDRDEVESFSLDHAAQGASSATVAWFRKNGQAKGAGETTRKKKGQGQRVCGRGRKMTRLTD